MKPLQLLIVVPMLAACGTDVSGPSASLLSCVFGEGTTLSVGQVLQVRGAGNQSLCLSAGEGTEDFVFIPFYATAAPEDENGGATVEVAITGGGFEPVVAASGDSQPAWFSLGPARRRPVPDAAFHRRLREREIRELEPRIRRTAGTLAAADPGARRPPAEVAQVPVVNDLLDLNVAISCTEEDRRTGRVQYVSDHAIVVADTANPPGLLSTDYRFFGETFDTLVHPVSVAHFGPPSDIDANGRALIFLTRAVNELTPPGSTTFTAGFFWSGDLFPEQSTPRLQACPAANQAEMFYMVTADPGGTIGVALTADEVRELAVGVIMHEFQHLINAGRRLYANDATRFERPWLNEGLSHVAEELLFFAVSGLDRGANLDIQDLRDVGAVAAFNEHMGGNFNNYARYLERPDTASLMGIDRLPTRGATWSFLRYAADRIGRDDADFFFDLVNSTDAGLSNLDEVLGGTGTTLDWMQDWTVSVYADDHVPGVDARFMQLSWNFRNIFENSTVEEYPLSTPALTSGGVFSVDLQPGGAAFPQFGVAGDGRAAVHVEVEGGVPPQTLRGSFLRFR